MLNSFVRELQELHHSGQSQSRHVVGTVVGQRMNGAFRSPKQRIRLAGVCGICKASGHRLLPVENVIDPIGMLKLCESIQSAEEH